MVIERLSLTAQTLHAELLDRLVAHEARRTIGHAAGSFVRKTIRGRDYVYFQHAAPGAGQRQVYLGPRSPALDALEARFREEQPSIDGEELELRRLAGAFRAAGGMTVDPTTARVLKGLAAGGIFAGGAVLVGTHAFIVLGNLLGRRWRSAALRTHDVDVSRPTLTDLDIAVTDAAGDVPGILTSLELGFLPIPSLDRKRPSTSFSVRGKELRLDLIAPGRSKDPPAFVPRFGAAAQPLDGVGFLVAAPARGAAVGPSPTLVYAPQPARFALHKLFLSRVRPIAQQPKARKDLAQAAELLEALAEDRPDDLRDAWRAMVRHHPREAGKARAAARQLASDFPDAHTAFVAIDRGA